MTTLRYVQENVNKHASNPWDIGTELSLYSLTFCFFQKLLRSFMRRVPAQIIIIQPEFTRGGWHTLSRSSAGSLGYGVFQAMLHVCPEHTIRCQRTVRKPRLIAHEQEVGVNWMAVESLRSCGRYSAVSRAIVSLSGVVRFGHASLTGTPGTRFIKMSIWLPSITNAGEISITIEVSTGETRIYVLSFHDHTTVPQAAAAMDT